MIDKEMEKFHKQLIEDIRCLSASLIYHGLKDKKIAVIGDFSYEWYISIISIIYNVGIAVILDTELCITELKQCLISTDSKCIIFSDDLKDVFWQIQNDGVTHLEMFVNMNKKESEYDSISLQQLIEDGKQITGGRR